jgi:site-specific recombinase XerD
MFSYNSNQRDKEGDMKNELNGFLHYLEVEKGFSPGTISAYRLDISGSFLPFLFKKGKCIAKEITREDIKVYMDYLTINRKNSVVTRARKLAAIKSFFKYMVENEMLENNPAASVSSPKIPEKEPEYLTEDECIRFLETIYKESKKPVHYRDIAIATLFLHNGLRVSELISLNLSDVDFSNHQIKITRKGNKEQYLHLNGDTIKTLLDYFISRPEGQNNRFFIEANGHNLSRRYTYGIIRRYLEMAGIEKSKHGPHLLRHTFCTRLHQRGVDPFTIKDLAGHKSLNTTMRYIKIENKEEIDAIDRLEFGDKVMA